MEEWEGFRQGDRVVCGHGVCHRVGEFSFSLSHRIHEFGPDVVSAPPFVPCPSRLPLSCEIFVGVFRCPIGTHVVSGSKRYRERGRGWIYCRGSPGPQYRTKRCIMGRPWVRGFLGSDRPLPAARDTRVSFFLRFGEGLRRLTSARRED